MPHELPKFWLTMSRCESNPCADRRSASFHTLFLSGLLAMTVVNFFGYGSYCSEFVERVSLSNLLRDLIFDDLSHITSSLTGHIQVQFRLFQLYTKFAQMTFGSRLAVKEYGHCPFRVFSLWSYRFLAWRGLQKKATPMHDRLIECYQSTELPSKCWLGFATCDQVRS